MMRRRCGRDTGAARRLAQGESVHPALDHQLLRGGNERLPEIAVMVAAPGRSLGPRANLDSVQIRLYLS
jgi:hypothetical protein